MTGHLLPQLLSQKHAHNGLAQMDGDLIFAVAEGSELPVRLRATDYAGRRSDWVEVRLIPASEWVYLPWIAR